MPPVLALMIATGTVTSGALPAVEIEQRVQFLEESLDGPQLHARVWWWGWLSFYSLAAAAQSVRLGLVDSADEDARAQRADYVISIVKAVGGVLSLLLLPFHATEGAEPMRSLEGGPMERMLAGEEALEMNARESGRRYSWLRHAILVAVNVAGGMIVWLGYDDFQRGAISAAIGIAVGEVIVWSQPWQPESSWEEYQLRHAD